MYYYVSPTRMPCTLTLTEDNDRKWSCRLLGVWYCLLSILWMEILLSYWNGTWNERENCIYWLEFQKLHCASHVDGVLGIPGINKRARMLAALTFGRLSVWEITLHKTHFERSNYSGLEHRWDHRWDMIQFLRLTQQHSALWNFVLEGKDLKT